MNHVEEADDEIDDDDEQVRQLQLVVAHSAI